MKRVTVDSHDSLVQLLADNKQSKALLLFTGSKDADGQSWCPDCNVSEPVVKKCLDDFEAADPEQAAETLFVTIFVGQRNAWKDPNNAFRKSKYGVKSVPTLLVDGNSSIKLEESQLMDEEMVNMLLRE